jgi:hypothetical protein
MRILLLGVVGCGGSGLGSRDDTDSTGFAACSIPDQASEDADGDGVCDLDDACPGSDDAMDADADLVPDDCDTCPMDRFDDTDMDGICDSDDVCPGLQDVDLDGDGQLDGCAGHSLTVTLGLTTNPQNPTFTIAVADEDLDAIDDGEVIGAGGFSSPDQVLKQDVVVSLNRWICIEMINPAGSGGVNGVIVDNDRTSTDGGPLVLIDFFDGSWSADYFQCAQVLEET